jgi:serine O-acetyltransferase
MWAALRADLRLYRALRWPRGGGWPLRAFLWLGSPGLLVLAVQRLGHSYLIRRERHGWTPQTLIMRFLMALGPRLLVLISKSDVASLASFEPGVFVSDDGYLILGPRQVGSGTLIHGRVTIGVTAGGTLGPAIGRNVWIGSDSVIYGDIALGDGVTVLPGSVLSMNVSAGSVVAGNPAIIVRKNFDNSALRSSLSQDTVAAGLP